MKAEELRPVMMSRVKDVTEVLGVPATAAMVLLRTHNFSKEQLLEDYMQAPEKILKRAGVFCRCGNAVAAPKSKDCAICYDEDCGQMIAMPCGHAFCHECWYDFCDNAVKEGPVCVTTTCPQAQCREVVTEEEMEKSLGKGAPALQKFLNYQLRAFVESNALTRWCPGRGCERVACAESESAME